MQEERAKPAKPEPITMYYQGAMPAEPLTVQLHSQSRQVSLHLSNGSNVKLDQIDCNRIFNELKYAHEVNLYQRVDGMLLAVHRLAVRQIDAMGA